MTQGACPTCLILSADATFRDSVGSALHELDARIEWAHDAGAALSALSVWAIRCFVVDLASGEDWVPVVSKLRRMPEFGDAPVLFIADGDAAVDAVLANPPDGHWDLMRKPLHARWLKAKVGQLIATELRVARSTAQSNAQLAMIDALPARVCVVDASANVVLGNRAWRQQQGIESASTLGWNYLDLCRAAASPERSHWSSIADGLRDVLRGDRLRFDCEYTVGDGDGQCHELLTIVRLGGDGGAVISQFDLTHQRRAEAERMKAMHHLQLVLDAIQMNLFEYDLASGRRVVGMRDDELLGARPLDLNEMRERFVHPEDRERFAQSVNDLLNGAATGSVEYRINGVEPQRWRCAVARVIDRDDTHAGRMVGVSWDISEQKQAEIALRDSEAQLRRALEAAHMVSWEWDLTTGVRRAIGDDHAVLGVAHDSIAAAKACVHPDDIERHYADIDQAIASGEPYQSEFRVIWPDGSIHWLLSRGTPMRDGSGRVVRLAGLVWDITARKQADAALVESRRLQELAIEGAGLNIWEIDIRSGVRHGGARDLDFFGRSPSSMAEFADIVGPDAYGRLAAAMDRAVSGTGPYEVEYSVPSNDGQRRWFASLGQLVRGGDGRPDKLVGVTYEVTAQREQEQTMRTALETAEQASRAKSTFLAATSHELRTPMNAVLGMTRLLVDTDLDARQRELLETIRSSGDLLLRLINDVLDFSRIEAGEMPIDATEFDTLACIESCIEIVAQQAESKGLDLFLDVAPEACRRVRGDPTRLRQILVNVLVNAIKFTDRGEVRLSVQAAPIEEGRVAFEFTVADTGIGMSEELLRQVFLPFRQGDGSSTRRHGGTGLGLAICRRLAELMQGEITATSVPGEGSRFRVCLPFDDHGSVLPELRNVQVMVASPHRASREAAVTQLRRFGISVMSCNGSDPLPESILVEQQLLLLDDRLFADYPELVDEILARHQREPAIARMVSLRDATQRSLPDWVRDLGTVIRPVRPSVLLGLLREFDAVPPTREVGDGPNVAKLSERHPLNVLVAEDNLINQMLVQMMLDALGYACDVVNNGREALDITTRKAYDVILMDVEMPEMDGIEASRALRMREGQQDMPQIIAVTAHVLTGSRERFLAAGMNDFVAKPIIIDELRAALIRAHEAKLRYQRTAPV